MKTEKAAFVLVKTFDAYEKPQSGDQRYREPELFYIQSVQNGSSMKSSFKFNYNILSEMEKWMEMWKSSQRHCKIVQYKVPVPKNEDF